MNKKNNLIYFIVAVLISFSMWAFAAEDVKEKPADTATTETVKFSQNGLSGDLKLTGTTTLKKFFVNVYNGAHYMQNPPKVKGDEAVKEILKDETGPKQITMHWLRNAPSQKIKNGFDEVFVKNLGSEYDKNKEPINQFLSFFNNDTKANDENIIYWLPGGVIIVMYNDKKMGEIKNPEFAKMVWDVWFGPNASQHAKNLTSKL